MGDPMDWPMDVFVAALDRARERAASGEKKSRAEIVAELKRQNAERKEHGIASPWFN